MDLLAMRHDHHYNLFAMLPKLADMLKAAEGRQWTINDAWALVQHSSSVGYHPDVHVIYPELHEASQSHFLTRSDFKGREYRDRPRHSLFRNPWEAAGAVCAAINTPAGEALLRMLRAGPAELRSRSAILGSPALLQRLQLEYKGTTTGISYFEQRTEHVFLMFVCQNGGVGLKTAYPVVNQGTVLSVGSDLVTQKGVTTAFPARR